MNLENQVCLVSLPSPFLIDDKVFPPLGILYLKAALDSFGVSAVVHDGPIEEIPSGFSHYGISATTPQFPLAVQALKQIRSYRYDKKIIIGGAHATVDSESCLNAGFDRVVCGPGEYAIISAINGEDGKVYTDRFTTGFDFIPDRKAINILKYKYLIDGRLATSVMTSRGCPFNCAFCCKSAGKVTFHPSEVVIKELNTLQEDFGYDAFMFFDDIFIANPERLNQILSYMMDRELLWRGFVRADMLLRLGDDMVRKMAKSGCVEVGMGVESGSDKILKLIHKGEDTTTIKNAVKLLHRHDIRVKGFFIVGLPSESRETVDDTAQFCFETQFDDIDFTVFQPFKGSHIYKNKKDYDIYWNEEDLKDLWYKGRSGEYHSNVFTSHLSSDEIVEARNYLERRFKK